MSNQQPSVSGSILLFFYLVGVIAISATTFTNIIGTALTFLVGMAIGMYGFYLNERNRKEDDQIEHA